MKLHTLAGLKKARKEEGLTQDQLAKRLNIQVQNVRNWEQGRTLPEYETLFKLMEIFDCDMDYLFGRIECRTHDKQFIHEQTGLSESVIQTLETWLNTDDQRKRWPEYLSRLIEHERFEEIMKEVSSLIGFLKLEYNFVMQDKPHEAIQAIDSEIARLYNISRVFTNIVEETAQEANSNVD